MHCAGPAEQRTHRPPTGAETLAPSDLSVGKTAPMTNVTSEQLAEHLSHIAAAPADIGTVELVVARPAIGERIVLERGDLRPGVGLIGDFDLSAGNCPAGTRLAIGTAVIEVTAKPHNGCAKFAERYGIDAARWVNSGKDLRLRGICAIVVAPGTVGPGDTISKV